MTRVPRRGAEYATATDLRLSSRPRLRQQAIGRRGEPPHDERAGCGDQAGDHRIPLSEPLNDRLQEAPLAGDVQRSHARERPPPPPRPPAVPVARIDDVAAREDLEGEE